MRFSAIVLALIAPVISAQTLEIKGVEVDKPIDCAYIRSLEQRPGTFAPSCENGFNGFATDVSFLDGQARMYTYQAGGHVTALLVTQVSNGKTLEFQSALDALQVKFGKPVVERTVIKNRAGAEFEQVLATWVSGDVRLELKKHGGRIDSPSLWLSGRRLMEFERERREQAAKKNSGNL
jgi:hypothetical protein